jgi:hypothetical protein
MRRRVIFHRGVPIRHGGLVATSVKWATWDSGIWSSPVRWRMASWFPLAWCSSWCSLSASCGSNEHRHVSSRTGLRSQSAGQLRLRLLPPRRLRWLGPAGARRTQTVPRPRQSCTRLAIHDPHGRGACGDGDVTSADRLRRSRNRLRARRRRRSEAAVARPLYSRPPARRRTREVPPTPGTDLPTPLGSPILAAHHAH